MTSMRREPQSLAGAIYLQVRKTEKKKRRFPRTELTAIFVADILS